MGKAVQSRRIIALAAAYVVALQALLLPLSVAAGPFTANLCAVGTSVDGSPSPAGHDPGCPCAAGCGMQCCVQTLDRPPQIIAVKLGVTRAIAMTPAPTIVPVIRMADRSPQVPRAPPAV